ncbi:MAG: hypothetical protein R6X07_05060, partial [Desulfatiglandales bacterium]
AVILSGATLFSLSSDDDRRKRCAHTLESRQVPSLELPFFMVTFGSKKASHGHVLSDEVGWHLIWFQSNFEKEDPLPLVQSDVFLFAF